jgi:hypothetical protein
MRGQRLKMVKKMIKNSKTNDPRWINRPEIFRKLYYI